MDGVKARAQEAYEKAINLNWTSPGALRDLTYLVVDLALMIEDLAS